MSYIEPCRVSTCQAISLAMKPLPITIDAVEELLRAAGASEPWRNPVGLIQASTRLTWLRDRLAETNQKPPARSAFDRAHAAVDELSRVLPEIRGWYSLSLPEGIPDPIVQSLADGREKIDRLEAALTAMSDVLGPGGKHPVIEGTWQERALICCRLFVVITGYGTASRNGPACRFAQSALVLIGDRQQRLGTIEAAIRRATNSS